MKITQQQYSLLQKKIDFDEDFDDYPDGAYLALWSEHGGTIDDLQEISRLCEIHNNGEYITSDVLSKL